MKILIPSPLLSYTRTREVSGNGATLAAVLANLDRSYPGIRFRMVDEQDRIRPHIRIFLNGQQTFNLATEIGERDTVQIVQALSGG
jgi:molybdopterin converting factor small subunit